MVDRLLNFTPPNDRFTKCIPVSVIGALGSIATGAVSSVISGNNSRQAIREQNEYNRPINQRARFEEAGLNPYLAMGSGVLGAGNQAAAADMSGANNALSNGLLSGMQQIGQISFQQAQIRKANAEATNQEINNQTQGVMNEAQVGILRQQLKDWTFKVDNLNPAELSKLNAQTDLLVKQKLTEIAKADNLDALTDKIFKEMKGIDLDNDMKAITKEQLKERLELERQVLRMQNITGFVNMVSQRMTAQGALMNAQASLTNANTNKFLSGYQADLLDYQARREQVGWFSDDNDYRYQVEHNKLDLEEKRRHFKYNEKFFDNPTADWWNSVLPRYLPFGPGSSYESREWMNYRNSHKPMRRIGF